MQDYLGNDMEVHVEHASLNLGWQSVETLEVMANTIGEWVTESSEITDFENIPWDNPSRYIPEFLDELQKYRDALEQYDQGIVDTYLLEYDGVLDNIDGCDDFIHVYIDSYSTVSEEYQVGEFLANEIGSIDFHGNETLRQYFDYEAYGRDCILNGDVMIIRD